MAGDGVVVCEVDRDACVDEQEIVQTVAVRIPSAVVMWRGERSVEGPRRTRPHRVPGGEQQRDADEQYRAERTGVKASVHSVHRVPPIGSYPGEDINPSTNEGDAPRPWLFRVPPPGGPAGLRGKDLD